MIATPGIFEPRKLLFMFKMFFDGLSTPNNCLIALGICFFGDKWIEPLFLYIFFWFKENPFYCFTYL